MAQHTPRGLTELRERHPVGIVCLPKRPNRPHPATFSSHAKVRCSAPRSLVSCVPYSLHGLPCQYGTALGAALLALLACMGFGLSGLARGLRRHETFLWGAGGYSLQVGLWCCIPGVWVQAVHRVYLNLEPTLSAVLVRGRPLLAVAYAHRDFTSCPCKNGRTSRTHFAGCGGGVHVPAGQREGRGGDCDGHVGHGQVADGGVGDMEAV